MEFTKRLYYLLFTIGIILLLIYAQALLVPFVLAILIWFVIRVLKNILRRIPFMHRSPSWLLTLISSVLLLSLLGLTIFLITNNIQELSTSINDYEANVNLIAGKINETFHIDLAKSVSDMISNFDFQGILSTLFSALTSLFGDTFLVLLYLVFLLLEEPVFPLKLKAIYKDRAQLSRVMEIMGTIDMSINNYVAIKTMMSLLTGFLSFFVLYFVGVDAPFFWAFIIFILNYIPTIGSLIATLFPTVFAMLQFGDFSHAVLVLTIVGAIQVVVGNFLEPRLMGNSLNISTLVVFLTLTTWGAIWGVTGMLLSVPITVIMILVLSEFPSTRPIAILLSKKGDVGGS